MHFLEFYMFIVCATYAWVLQTDTLMLPLKVDP